MKASDLMGLRPFIDALIYGQPGTGKSARGARCPLPFIALTEAHGLATIASINPDADVEIIEDAPAFFELMTAIKKGAPVKLDNGQPAYRFSFRGEERTCQTVVLDSATDLGERILQWLAKDKGGEAGGFDWTDMGAEVQQIPGQVWQRYKNILGAAFHDLRALPVHVLCLALVHEEQDGEGGRKIMRPRFYGQLKAGASAWFSVTGYADKTSEGTYVVRWNLPPDRAVTKKLPGWPNVSRDDIDEPGVTTLGSLALACINAPSDLIPHAEGDDADHASPKAKDDQPTTTRRRRASL